MSPCELRAMVWAPKGTSWYRGAMRCCRETLYQTEPAGLRSCRVTLGASGILGEPHTQRALQGLLATLSPGVSSVVLVSTVYSFLSLSASSCAKPPVATMSCCHLFALIGWTEDTYSVSDSPAATDSRGTWLTTSGPCPSPQAPLLSSLWLSLLLDPSSERATSLRRLRLAIGGWVKEHKDELIIVFQRL